MSSYKILIEGETPDLDDIREMFETLVRQLRFDGDPDGTLELDGVTYAAADVPDEAAGLDASEAGEETQEEPVARD